MANKPGWLWIAAIAGGALWLSTQQRRRTTRPGVPAGGPSPLAPLAPLDILHPPVTSPVVVVPPVAFPPVFGMPGIFRQQPPVTGGNRSGGSTGLGVSGDEVIIVTQYRPPPVDRMPGPLGMSRDSIGEFVLDVQQDDRMPGGLGRWSNTIVADVLDVQQDDRPDDIWETPFVDRMPGPLGMWSNDDDDDDDDDEELEELEELEDVEYVEDAEYETEYGYPEDWE